MLYDIDSLIRLEKKPFDYYGRCLEKYRSEDHKAILSNLFHEKLGYWPSIDNPKTYNEKLQWLKLFWRDDTATKCTDKLIVKDYLRSTNYGSLVIDTLAIYENEKDFRIKDLPRGFVLKPTHASGYNLFVTDSSKLDNSRVKRVLGKILRLPYYAAKLEWNYEDITPRLIVEPLLPIKEDRPLDYKFYCFHGCVQFVEITTACEWGGSFEPYELIVDKFFKRLDFSYSFENRLTLQKPKDFDCMVSIAELLSAHFPHVRIDLLNPEDGCIKFGEFTFFPSAGFGRFIPDEMDNVIGAYLNIQNLSL